MIWLSWRHLRTEILIVGAVLLGLGVLFIPTGLQMRDDYRDDQLATCVSSPSEECDRAIDRFEEPFATVMALTDWFAILPILIATLIAAPFVQELERRSYRLAWTQSITRRRWTTIKLGMIVAGALVSSALLSLLLTWWREPLDHLEGRLDPGIFQLEGIAFPIYCLFSAALVIAIGTILRRTVPTIVIAAVVFIAIRVVIETWLRPYYQSASSGDESALTTVIQTAWVLRHHTNVDGTVVIDYHPDARFWRFQLIESVLFLVLSVGLVAGSASWILRRID